MTEELLKRNHVEVSCCTDSNAVLDFLKKTVFDAVITDIQMPGMDGYQLLKAVRTSGIDATDTIPVIALSASVEKDHTHYTEAGFTGFLNKPFTAKQLITLLNQLLITNLSPDTAVEFNFNSLTAFAGEDKEASASIVRTFTDETGKSITLLQEALDKNDRSQASKVAHKLLPLFSMLGAKNLIAQLRMLEINDEALTDSGWQRLMNDVIHQAAEIVEQAKLKL
jgi:CheY-like chemotaxis protein